MSQKRNMQKQKQQENDIKIHKTETMKVLEKGGKKGWLHIEG